MLGEIRRALREKRRMRLEDRALSLACLAVRFYSYSRHVERVARGNRFSLAVAEEARKKSARLTARAYKTAQRFNGFGDD